MNLSTTHKIINGDSRNMSDIDDNSIHLVVTSPPYWQLKDYGTTNQIGFNDSYEDYINNLNLVWQQSYRVLHNGCRLCINIGDQFARAVYYGRYKVIPIRQEIIKFCEVIGFDYMGAIIWQKVTTSNTTGGGVQMGSYPYPRNGILKIDYEFILIFKKLGEAPKPLKEQKELSKMTPDEWNTYFAGHWNFPGVKQKSHLAMFPEELPARLIKMFSFVGENVLDPFAGSGTTSLAAKKLNRNSFAYEINPDFIPIIKDKLGINQNDLEETKYEFITSMYPNNYLEKISELPYLFRDPHNFNNKIELKKLQFGSKIDNIRNNITEKTYTVSKINSPEIIILDNNLKIRLLGLKEKPEVNGKAIDYLEKKIKGKKVLLKYDEVKYDKDDNLLCYMYLENKTFINAHLIRNNLVNLDNEYTHRLKDKFIKLMAENG